MILKSPDVLISLLFLFLSGVTQDMLETVVPRTPLSVVRVVKGKEKNKVSSLLVWSLI